MLKSDRFKLETPLEEGDLGTLWRGNDPSSGAPLAVSILDADAPDAVRKLLETSAEALTAAKQPALPKVHTVQEDADGGLSVAWEWIEGVSLAERLTKRSSMTTTELVRIVTEILDGLERVHAEGSAHGDIGPTRIVLSGRTERPRLIGFGLNHAPFRAGLAESDEATVLASVAFASPEQARGESVAAAGDDLWSVAAVLYAAFAPAPFAGSTLSSLREAVARAELAPIEKVRPELKGALAEVIDRALAKERDKRYPDAASLRKALRASLLVWGRGALVRVGGQTVLQAAAQPKLAPKPDARAASPRPVEASKPAAKALAPSSAEPKGDPEPASVKAPDAKLETAKPGSKLAESKTEATPKADLGAKSPVASAAKTDATKRAPEPAKREPATAIKPATAKPEAAIAKPAAKIEASKPERQGTIAAKPRPASANAESAKSDTAKVESTKRDAPRVEAAQSAKSDAARTESAKSDAAKPEAAKPEAERAPESAKAAAGAKPEAAKPEAERTPESAKPAVGEKPESPSPTDDGARPSRTSFEEIDASELEPVRPSAAEIDASELEPMSRRSMAELDASELARARGSQTSTEELDASELEPLRPSQIPKARESKRPDRAKPKSDKRSSVRPGPSKRPDVPRPKSETPKAGTKSERPKPKSEPPASARKSDRPKARSEPPKSTSERPMPRSLPAPARMPSIPVSVAPPPKRSLTVPLVFAAIVGVVVVLAIWKLVPSEPPADVGLREPVAAETPEPPSPPAPVTPPPVAPTPPAPVEPRLVAFEGAPPRAVFLVDGRPIDPSRIELPSTGTRALEVRAPGFEPYRADLTADSPERITLELVRVREERPREIGVTAMRPTEMRLTMTTSMTASMETTMTPRIVTNPGF